MSKPAVAVRMTVKGNMAMIIISFHFVEFYFVLICFVSVQIAVAANLFLKPVSCLSSTSHFASIIFPVSLKTF